MNESSPILAINLGKYHSVLAEFHTSASEVRFRTVHTTPDEWRRELLREPVGQVVFEAGSQAGSRSAAGPPGEA